MADDNKETVDEAIKADAQSKGSENNPTTPSQPDGASRLTPGVRSESTDSARPISTTSRDAISEGATSSTTRRRKREKALPPGAHRVNMTINISVAIPSGNWLIDLSTVFKHLVSMSWFAIRYRSSLHVQLDNGLWFTMILSNMFIIHVILLCES